MRENVSYAASGSSWVALDLVIITLLFCRVNGPKTRITEQPQQRASLTDLLCQVRVQVIRQDIFLEGFKQSKGSKSSSSRKSLGGLVANLNNHKVCF